MKKLIPLIFFGVILSWFAQGVASAAITFQASSTSGLFKQATSTFSYTLTGDWTLLTVGFSLANSSLINGSSVTMFAGGATTTFVRVVSSTDAPHFMETELWIATTTATGNASITVTAASAGGFADSFSANAMGFLGTNVGTTTNATSSSQDGNNSDTAASTTVNTSANSMVVDIAQLNSSGETVTPKTGQTMVFNQNQATVGVTTADSYKAVASGASTSTGYTYNVATQYAIAAADFNSSPIAFVQKSSSTQAYTSTAVGNASATFPGNTATGDAIIVSIQYGNASGRVSGCRDTNNVTSTYLKAATAFNASSTQGEDVWYALNITGGTTPKVTCTVSTNTNFMSMAIQEYSGIATTSALDATSTSVITTSSTILTTGTSTTNAANELIYGSFVGTFDGNWTFTRGNGFTNRINNGTTAGLNTEDLIQSSAGAVSAFATATPADQQANIMVTFKPSGSTPVGISTATQNTMASVAGIFQTGNATFQVGNKTFQVQ